MLPVFHPATGRPFMARSPGVRQRIVGRLLGNQFATYLAIVTIVGFLSLIILANRGPSHTTTLDTIPLREQVNKEEIQQLQDAANYQNGNNAEEIEDNTQNYIDNQQQTQTNLQSIVKRRGVVVQPDPNESEENVARRNAVKEAFRHAYEGYEKHCFGQDEFRPNSRTCHNWLSQGLTIIDSLDTMLIMGMFDHFKRARDWIESSLDFDRNVDVSVFETNIRVLGGLLTAYDFTQDEVFLKKAKDIADRLLPAFNTPTGIPNAMVNLRTGKSRLMSWTSGSAVLAEVGTLQMEFVYLSHATGDPKYAEKAMRIIEVLRSKKPSNNLYPIYVNPNTGDFNRETISFGALGDSFYEYLVKVWVLTKKSLNWLGEMYYDAAEAALDLLAQKTKPSNLDYLAEMQYGRLVKKVDHLACFATGMFALGAIHAQDPAMKNRHLEFAKGFGEFCYQMYARSPTKLSPEYVEADDTRDFKPPDAVSNRYYALRPEVIEALFYLYRVTKDQKYRDWGWEMFKAIEKHCKSEHGYSGVRDVTAAVPTQDDTQQSWFLAETLKYFYLLFSPDEYISLDEFVFNTEAHPLALFDYPLKQ